MMTGDAGTGGDAGTLFGGAGPVRDERREAETALARAYESAGRTLDDLPYTKEFESIASAARGVMPGATDREVFHRLHNLRKAGRLPRVGRAASEPLQVLPEDEARLASLVTAAVGSLGQRDQLPYTPAFDRIVQEFNAATGRSLDPHGVWRLMAKIAK